MHDAQAVTGDIEAMAFRLRQGIAKENEAFDQQGRSDGRDWAMKHASARELRDLGDADGVWIIGEGHSLCPDLWQIAEDEHHLTCQQDGMWSANLTDAYWQGFAEAALEAYQAAWPLI